MCLIPTTIGALLSAIGIAGNGRLVQHNELAIWAGGGGGRRREHAAAGQGRPHPRGDGEVPGDSPTAQLSEPGRETPEGSSSSCWRRTSSGCAQAGVSCRFVPFANPGMSGVDLVRLAASVHRIAAAAVMRRLRHGELPPRRWSAIVI